ncbi:nuclear transport factor 2 family protein [Jejudonia soesokkakensis]|uniref:Nuclear transport factor 2 family protein n=1 Tax=Jejudonia soesokkakensis TaxID=1323432 RepID=A0ABW2MRF3_9FLAO
MKFLFSILMLGFSVTITAQDFFTEADAKGLIDTFFEGFHKGDTLLMQSVLAENVVLQSASVNREGKNVLSVTPMSGFLKSIGSRPEDQVWKEKLLGYEVQIDGNLAHVWTPYEFWYNGTFSHCGANAFTIAKLEEGWKIIHLIDSRRRDDCQQE